MVVRSNAPHLQQVTVKRRAALCWWVDDFDLCIAGLSCWIQPHLKMTHCAPHTRVSVLFCAHSVGHLVATSEDLCTQMRPLQRLCMWKTRKLAGAVSQSDEYRY